MPDNPQEKKKKTPEEIVAEHERLLHYDGPDRIVSAAEVWKRATEKGPAGVLAKSGIDIFDDALKGGFFAGQVVVISGHTNEGKTSLCRTFTDSFAKQGINPLWFSYEEVEEEFLEKFPATILPFFYMPNELTDKSIKWVHERIKEGKLKYNCRAVFVDHLHYLVDLYKIKNASIEIGAVMRSIKKVAIANRVAFFLVSHVAKIDRSRELQAGDIRDCLPAGQMVYTTGGLLVPVEEMKAKTAVMSRRSIRELQPDTVTDVWPAGPKTILRITTATGRVLECSENHKLYALTYHKKGSGMVFAPNQGSGIAGWTEANRLQVRQKIACVREYPRTITQETITKEQAFLLGWIVGDGHINAHYNVEITVATETETKTLIDVAYAAFGLRCRITSYTTKKAFRVYLTDGGGLHGVHHINLLSQFLRERSYHPTGVDKHVPPDIFTQPPEIVAAFMSGLFQADGSMSMSGKTRSMAVINLHTISKRLATEVKHLLLRIGIVGWIRAESMKSSGFRTKNGFIYVIGLYGQSVVRFRERIGFVAEKQEKMNRLLQNWHPKALATTSHICFERVKAVDVVGVKETFDISVRGHHCSLKNNSFCVEDIITHNSSFVEQEADIVMYVWRDKNKEDTSIVKITKNRKRGKVNIKAALHFDEALGIYDYGKEE